MKQITVVGLFIFNLVFITTGIGFAASLLDEIISKKEMVVSTDANYAPQSYINDNGELEGFDISVAKEVAKRLHIKVRFVTPDWEMITTGRWGKRWDISIGSMAPTKERKNSLWFTLPYYGTPAQFAIHKNNTTIKNIDDLEGKVIGVGSETTFERYLNRDLKIEDVEIRFQNWTPGEIRTYPTDANHIEDLALGDGVRLDAVFTSVQVVDSAIREGCGGNGCPLKRLGEYPFSDISCFALDKTRPNSESFLKKLNEVILSMYNDGTLQRFSIEFFKTDMIPKLTHF